MRPKQIRKMRNTINRWNDEQEIIDVERVKAEFDAEIDKMSSEKTLKIYSRTPSKRTSKRKGKRS